jgi:hypothetical protein
MLQYLRAAMSYAYAFKPGRTFAQVLAAALVADGTGLLDTDWKAKLSVAGMAALIGFLQGWSDGSDQIAESTVSNKILGKA